MAMLDGVMGQLGGLDLAALAGRVGLTEDQVRTGAAALIARITGGQDAPTATADASAETGIDAGKLGQLLPMLTQHLGGGEGGTGGLLGSLGGMLGGGGEGHPGGIADMAKGLFGKN